MLYCLLLPILIPVICGAVLLHGGIPRTKSTANTALLTVLAVSVLTGFLLFLCPEEKLELLRFTDSLSFTLRIDGFSRFFAGMVAVLWPVALIYAFTYLAHDERRFTYFGFYIMTYGVVLGIAFAANALTMYVFYEALTFITLPLITHTETKEARRAGRHYLYYSLGGSSLALAGLIILTVITGTNDFVSSSVSGNTALAGMAYLFTFFGFGVKAAVFPLCGWLPEASAAPTPTTALLHAVAVVKAGAFAIFRMTYSIFDPASLHGSFARQIALGCVALTIVYGSTMAVREQHFKRRFAYSTVANLSYILYGALFCTPAGLFAGMMHFIVHSFTKICIFFCCGAVIETTGAEYVWQLSGLGRKMPKIFTVFTVAGLSLIGMPFFAGFVSKYYLVSSAIASGSPIDYVGMGAIILSAILTSVYVLSVSFRAFARPPLDACRELYDNACEPVRGFLWTAGFFAVICVMLGVCASPICILIQTLIGGIV